jgi:GSH-dependent disulfide-bond oxidoreductase
MYELHAWPTPNGYKISILLEELGQPYTVVPIDIGAGDQFKPAFLEISPNNRMPALVDPKGADGKPISIFESGAIMMYLAEKHGAFWPQDVRDKYDVVQWLMFQMASVGPMLGQAGHFHNYAPEKIPYALDRYTNEAKRIYGVTDRRLGKVRVPRGQPATRSPTWRSIRGCACPIATAWTSREFKNVQRWRAAIEARPAVQKGLKLLEDRRRVGPPDAKQREVLFGATQFQRR